MIIDATGRGLVSLSCVAQPGGCRPQWRGGGGEGGAAATVRRRWGEGGAAATGPVRAVGGNFLILSSYVHELFSSLCFQSWCTKNPNRYFSLVKICVHHNHVGKVFLLFRDNPLTCHMCNRSVLVNCFIIDLNPSDPLLIR